MPENLKALFVRTIGQWLNKREKRRERDGERESCQPVKPKAGREREVGPSAQCAHARRGGGGGVGGGWRLLLRLAVRERCKERKNERKNARKKDRSKQRRKERERGRERESDKERSIVWSSGLKDCVGSSEFQDGAKWQCSIFRIR